MSSGSDKSFSDEDDNSSEEELIQDFAKLRPYDHEPTVPSAEISTSSASDDEDADDSEQEEQERIGNVDWCGCGKCRPMLTFTESLCCQDTNEVPEELFEGT